MASFDGCQPAVVIDVQFVELAQFDEQPQDAAFAAGGWQSANEEKFHSGDYSGK